MTTPTRPRTRMIAALFALALALIGLQAPSRAAADIPAGYYDPADGLTGTALKSALHDIIDDHTQISYDEVWDALQETDQDPANSNNVIEIYSGTSIPKSEHGGDQGDWNREHVWAKSHGDFGTATGPGTDVHHLRPADVGVNSVRSNKDFDDGGSAVDGAPDNFTDEDSYEPSDEWKGDVARMILYMDVRYAGDDSYPDLEVNDQVDNGSAPNIGRISVLLQWNELDPPSSFEQTRNDVIYDNWQHNRNPFIDHPEYADAIYGS
ncbi:endonuclease I family protein [Microlunatus soli]|uniref:Endonuclease I n=1 Tax=Microlunatus soli TaxID=630515 RepID=A0A1H2A6M4_9ACTN|nr:endonuclease [Microlunatus soli]SDT41096.1 Endonuclease I [Microlunatus soli]